MICPRLVAMPHSPEAMVKTAIDKQKIVAAAQAGRDPAGDRQDGGVGGQVAGEDPLAVDDRRRQAAGDVAQATLAMVVSSTSMNVGMTTATATTQGLIAARPDSSG